MSLKELFENKDREAAVILSIREGYSLKQIADFFYSYQLFFFI